MQITPGLSYVHCCLLYYSIKIKLWEINDNIQPVKLVYNQA